MAVGELSSTQRRWRSGVEQRPSRTAHVLHGNPVVDSTRTSLMKPIRLIQNGREALWRITEADREKLFRLLFHRNRDSEWGTFSGCGYRRTHWGILERKPTRLNSGPVA